jgi:hypothetical protein
MLMIPKDTKFYGENKKIAVIYGNGGARSSSFAKAQARALASNTQSEAFFITRCHDYGVGTIDGETIEATANDSGALMSAAKTEFDSVLDNLTISSTSALYGAGYGNVGQVKANTVNGDDFFTLKDPNDVVNLQIGQTLLAYSAVTGGAARIWAAGVSGATITGIDRDSGLIHVTGGTIGAATTVVANDYLFVDGDYGVKMKGLAAWLPRVAPTVGGGDSFFGVDRSVDPVRLAGVRYNGTGMPIEEVLSGVAARLFREGASPSHTLLPLDKYTELQNALGSKVQYVNVTSKDVAGIGFTGIKINTPKAVITVLPSAFLPSDTGFMLSLDTWKLNSLGEHIRPLMLDGQKMLRSASADSYEGRFGYYSQVSCVAPGHSANIQLA